MRKLLFAWIAAPLFLLSACNDYPDDIDLTTENLVVSTQYDTKVDFKSFNTFAIRDSIMVLNKKDSTIYLKSAIAGKIINEITSNLTALGYTKVDTSDSPNLAINVSVLTQKFLTVSPYPGWYWDYFPGYLDWWGGYWNGYYPYYPYYPSYMVSSYETGTLYIDMLDMKNASTANQKIPIVWSASIRGLVGMGYSDEKILQSVNQAFDQTIPFKSLSK